MTLKNKTVLITGSSRGIGRSIALRCAAAGANVVLASKTVEPHPKLEGTILTVAKEVEEAGGTALPLQLDVREEDQVRQVVEETVQRFGGLDVVVNNAGAIALMATEHLPVKRFDLMMGINVRAVFVLAHHCIPYLKEAGNPHILSLSPPIDLQPKWFKAHTAYTISKFGMTMMTLGLAEELSEYGIAANSLWPRTLIATAAVNMLGGEPMLRASRKPEIMAEAAYAIITSPAKEVTGNAFIDEDVLRKQGVTNFDRYANVPGEELLTDLFLE